MEGRKNASKQYSGQGGIRTLDTLAGIPVFETGSFSHSDTCPGTDSTSSGDEVYRVRSRFSSGWEHGVHARCGWRRGNASVRDFQLRWELYQDLREEAGDASIAVRTSHSSSLNTGGFCSITTPAGGVVSSAAPASA